ncbi:hypothetical protein BS47DRAFT_1394533 [Hydnum rufescens UP504]|uniref:Secreted protein n=1 Tax=Hydnum rufescens UP504 TaxID=1448309 RepID=A0A9P6AUC9_9AGAM|nr:hypothetical protein BS47DRAFT_1394533 [Hydnum rufescens UP504]
MFVYSLLLVAEVLTASESEMAVFDGSRAPCTSPPELAKPEPVSPTFCLALVWSVGHHAQTDFFVGPHLSYYCGIMPSSNCMLSNILYRVSVTRTFVFKQNTYVNSLPRCSPSVGTQSTYRQRAIDPSTLRNVL